MNIDPVPERLLAAVASQSICFPRVAAFNSPDKIRARLAALRLQLAELKRVVALSTGAISKAHQQKEARIRNEFKALAGKLYLRTLKWSSIQWSILDMSLQLSDEPRSRWNSAAEFNREQNVSIANYIHIYDTVQAHLRQ